MTLIDFLALAANVGVAILLYAHRNGDSNMCGYACAMMLLAYCGNYCGAWGIGGRHSMAGFIGGGGDGFVGINICSTSGKTGVARAANKSALENKNHSNINRAAFLPVIYSGICG